MVRGLKKNIPLSRYTTYQIGGRADYLVAVKNIQTLRRALEWARERDLPIFILAGGSNVLFADKGFPGLVIKIANPRIEFGKNRVRVGAGVVFSDLIEECIKRGYAGLEWAGGLPGTLGGAIRGNAGCFGAEIKDVIEEVVTISWDGQTAKYSNAECGFAYRDSRFKGNPEIIWEASLILKPRAPEKLKKEVLSHIRYRESRHPLDFPNCGSVFKNVALEKIAPELRERFEDKVKSDPFEVLPAAVLISAAGLSGQRIGGAQVSEKHSNFIVNLGSASAQDVLGLIGLVKERVKEEFGVKLEQEIEIVGF